MLKRSKIDDEFGEGDGGDHSDRVLVVNSDANSLELIARLLESKGWRATRLEDAAGVLIELGDAQFAGIVLDLPNLDDSIEVVRNVRGATGDEAKTPVLVLTSTGGDEGAALRAGADGFLSRPFHAADFLQQAELVLGGAP